MKRFFLQVVVVIALVLTVLLAPSFSKVSLAQTAPYTAINTARYTLYFGTPDSSSLPTGKGYVKDVAQNALSILDSTLDEYGKLFQVQPEEKVVLRFLSPEDFRKETGAPAWTSAMFYRGEISIPMRGSNGLNYSELNRALRHEVVHAMTAEISNYRCPAWLDEGLAQMMEGKANPLLGPALRNWIASNEAMPLEWLQNGFTTLDAKIVPAAYAQSLFATRQLVEQSGFNAAVTYLTLLKQEVPEQLAFYKAFEMERSAFEATLTEGISNWAKTDLKDP